LRLDRQAKREETAMRGVMSISRWHPLLWAGVLAAGVALSPASYAADKHDRGHGKHRDHVHVSVDRSHHHHVRHPVHVHHYRPGWHYVRGRYWAPPHYRGRYCNDRRHYHDVHYHVSVRDYYDYYYPRYRPVFGIPQGSASVIISIPLF